MLRIRQIKIEVTKFSNEVLKEAISKKLRIDLSWITSFRIVKESLDARNKNEIFYVYEVDVSVKNEENVLKKVHSQDIFIAPNEEYVLPKEGNVTLKDRPIIVGSGPAGLFTGYLLAKSGYRPLILERGEKVEDRIKTVEQFWKTGKLNTDSNVQFGEGGAGTFSDGKLNTLVNDAYFRKKKVLETFVECGAPSDILYSYKPHIGTDILTSVVRNINIHLDKNFYEEEFNTDVSKDTSMLVNKYYLLGSDYAPSDLVTISQTYSWGDAGSQKTRKVTYDAFLEMWNAAQEEQGYYLMVSSSYRSYQEQEIVYNNYKKTRGQKYADSIAARPGASEHQTGLTLDIFNKLNNNKNTFKDTDTAKWLENNAYRFGFILRYPEDKVKVTGYSYEAWHFRYVGKEIAKYVYENNITFEEYYAYYIEK